MSKQILNERVLKATEYLPKNLAPTPEKGTESLFEILEILGIENSDQGYELLMSEHCKLGYARDLFVNKKGNPIVKFSKIWANLREGAALTSPKAIRDQIITLLKAANPKNGVGQGIKEIFKGEPPKSRWHDKPWGWVEWTSGAMQAPVGSKAEIRDSFVVVIVDKHIDAEKAEDSVMDFAESIEAALDDSPTIGGLVAASYVVNREKQKVFLEGDYSMVAVRITLATRRRE
jgi:hypothetical protein